MARFAGCACIRYDDWVFDSMSYSFDRNSPRVRKSKLYTKFSKDTRFFVRIFTILLFLSGGLLWATVSSIAGSFLVSAGFMALLPLLWYNNEIEKLDDKLQLPQETGGALETMLPARITGRLVGTESPHMFWMGLKGTWYQNVFSVRYGVPIDVFEYVSKQPNPELVNSILTEAHRLSQKHMINHLSPVCLLIALLKSYPNYVALLAELKLSPEDVEESVRWIHNERQVLDKLGEKRQFGGLARDWTAGFTPTLSKMAIKVTDYIEQGGLDHLSLDSHAQTIDEMIINMQKPRSNVLLIGEVGSGKTMTVHGLAKRLIQDGSLPERIRYSKMYQVSASAIISSIIV